MFRPTLAALAFCLTAACATTPDYPDPVADYSLSVAQSSTPVYASIAEAVAGSESVPAPTKPLYPRWEIGPDLPRVKLGATLSNFRVFSLELQAGQPVTISVTSICNGACLGTQRTALLPDIYLADASGTVIAHGPSKVIGNPGALFTELGGVATEQGKHYILVAARNDAPGSVINVTKLSINNMSAQEFTIRSSPFGQIVVAAKMGSK